MSQMPQFVFSANDPTRRTPAGYLRARRSKYSGPMNVSGLCVSVQGSPHLRSLGTKQTALDGPMPNFTPKPEAVLAMLGRYEVGLSPRVGLL
jgi:hypothetical protein